MSANCRNTQSRSWITHLQQEQTKAGITSQWANIAGWLASARCAINQWGASICCMTSSSRTQLTNTCTCSTTSAHVTRCRICSMLPSQRARPVEHPPKTSLDSESTPDELSLHSAQVQLQPSSCSSVWAGHPQVQIAPSALSAIVPVETWAGQFPTSEHRDLGLC